MPYVENCLNEIHHETTEFTTVELHLGTVLTRFWEKWLTPLVKREVPLGTKIMLARERIKKKRGAHAIKENARAHCTRYRIGDLVLVKACNLSNAADNLIAKFLTLYEGPYIIEEQRGPSTYKLVNPNTRETRGVFHASNFRPCLQNVNTKPEEADKEEAAKRDFPHPAVDSQRGDRVEGQGKGKTRGVKGAVPGQEIQRTLNIPTPRGGREPRQDGSNGSMAGEAFCPAINLDTTYSGQPGGKKGQCGPIRRTKSRGPD